MTHAIGSGTIPTVPLRPDHITVSMPAYKARTTIRRAVDSVLSQSHRHLTLIVVNDGHPPDKAWDRLADIGDSRLVRFDLPVNHGRYYADAVTLAACGSKWWTVHDADDWTETHRLEVLLKEAERTGAQAVFGGYRQHRLDGTKRVVSPGVHRMQHSAVLRHVAHHTALFDTEALRSIGGPHPEFRIAYDTFMIGVVARRLRFAQVDNPMYHHCHQPNSLMQSPLTGKINGRESPARQEAHARINELWQAFIRADLKRPGSGPLPEWRPEVRASVEADAARLREVLG